MKHLLIIVLMLAATFSFAQNNNTIKREGFVFGFGVGGGVLSIANSYDENPFDEAQGGISLPNLKIGWMLNERLAVLATFPGLIYEFEGKDRSFEGFIPTIQYWVKDRWWINGGVGLSMDMPAFYEVENIKDEDWNFGCAVSASTGYEIVRRNNFALDLQTRIHLGRAFLGDDEYRDGAAFTIGVGFNWY